MNFPIPNAKMKNDPENPSRQCSNCFAHCRHFIHHVRLRGSHRLLCTACVLHLHPTSFCPLCFSFYDGTLPHPSKRVSCSNCSSSAHSHCAAAAARPLTPFLCPPCRDPTFSYFPQTDAIDERMAVILLCAARVASASIRRAVVVARAEEDRKVREAALARKRAREAIEHLISVSSKEKATKIVESSVVDSIENKMEHEGLDGDFVRDLEANLVKDEVLGPE